MNFTETPTPSQINGPAPDPGVTPAPPVQEAPVQPAVPTPPPVQAVAPAPVPTPAPTPEPAPVAPAAPVVPTAPAPDPAPTPPSEPSATPEPVVAATTAAPAPEKPKFKFKPSRKQIILAAVVALLILGAAGGVYYWQQAKLAEKQATLNAVSDGNTTLRLQLTKLQVAEKPAIAAATAIAPGTNAADDLVLAAVKSYCAANVDPTTKKPLILKVTASGHAKKQVLYSADKTFAYVNAACNAAGSTVGSIGYYLKKVDNNWVFLYRGAAVNPEFTKQFNIPAAFN